MSHIYGSYLWKDLSTTGKVPRIARRMTFSAWLWGQYELFPLNIDGMTFLITANIAYAAALNVAAARAWSWADVAESAWDSN